MSRPVLHLLLAIVAIGTVLASATAASSSLVSVCGLCDEQFEEAAADAGYEVTVVHSTVTVQLHEEGSATWTVRNTLADDRTLREDEDALVTILDGDSLHRDVVGDRTDFRTRLDGGTAVVTFRTPDVAHRGIADTLLFDALQPEPRQALLVFRGDELVIRAPDGYGEVATPGEVAVESGDAVWRDDVDAGYVAFAGGDGPIALASAHLAIATETVGDVAPTVLSIVAAPLAVIALVLGLAAASDHRSMDRPSRQRLAGILAVVGLGGASLPVLNGPVLLGFDHVYLAVGLGYAALAGLLLRLPDRPSYRRVLATTGIGPTVALVVAVSFAVAAGTSQTALADAVVRAIPVTGFVGAVALFLPFGYAVGSDFGRRWPAPIGILVGVELAVLPAFPPGPPIGGQFVARLTLALGVPLAFLGGPLFAVGYGLASGDEPKAGIDTDPPTGRSA